MGITRFRAYQLGAEGSSFSYCHDGNFSLIEARLTTTNVDNISSEITNFANNNLTTLHITSWDRDHCDPDQLESIITYLKPSIIEYPGYLPQTETAKKSLVIINQYKRTGGTPISYTPQYINSLDNAKSMTRSNIIYWPKDISSNSNDNSTAKLFRQGHFSVLSLGDLDSKEIAYKIIGGNIICNEVDVMILAHHGADNGFTSDELLDAIDPRVAICTSNYDSQFDHPKDDIRKLLYEKNIPLFTTKTGDIIIQNLRDDVSQFNVINLKANSTEVSSTKTFNAKSY